MATVRRTVVSEPGDRADMGSQYDRSTERRWAFDVSDLIALLAGLFYLVVGLIALIDLGFSDFPSEATAEVAGLAHTQIWGIVSIVIGLLLLAGAGGHGRSMTTFAGAVLLVIGIVVVAALDDLDETMTTNSAYGWTAIVIGAIVLLAAIAVPTVASRSERVIDRTA